MIVKIQLKLYVLAWVFINFSIIHSHEIFYSEDGQDKLVYKKFFRAKKNPGFFVDIGAHAGVIHSNTYFFEKQLGWHGICFEPNPELYISLVKNRTCITIEAAVAPETGPQLFVKHPCNWVSGLNNYYALPHREKWSIDQIINADQNNLIQVMCYNLNEILDKYGIKQIDFLSIDVEGAELAIIKSIDYERVFVDVIVVENIYKDPTFAKFLADKGFTFIERCHRDEIYRNNKG